MNSEVLWGLARDEGCSHWAGLAVTAWLYMHHATPEKVVGLYSSALRHQPKASVRRVRIDVVVEAAPDARAQMP